MQQLIDFINNDIKPLKSSDTISDALIFFEEYQFSHFPILDNNIYIGSIAFEDVETFDYSKKLEDYKINLEGFYTRDNMSLLEVLEVFARKNTNILPVLNHENKYIGYYDFKDVANLLTSTIFIKESGTTLIIEKSSEDYSFSQVAQIVESNNARVLGCFISAMNNGITQITIKITLGSINDIIQTFRRYEYEMISKHEEDDYLKTLKERTDYLEKYLNI